MIRRARPILLVLGPSASGKSTLGRALGAQGFHHLELDIPPELRQRYPVAAPIREALEVLADRARAGPLAAAIESMDQTRTTRGTVMTFDSVATLPPRHAAAVERAGFDLVVLFAKGAELLDAYLARERAAGRPASAEYWTLHNARSHPQFGAPHHAAHRVTTYRDGAFIGADALVQAVASRLASRNPRWQALVPDVDGEPATAPALPSAATSA